MSAIRRSLLRFGNQTGQERVADAAAPIGLLRAIEIARTQGLVRATEAACDGRAWDVEGLDASGREIEVAIDPRDGRVLKVLRPR